MWPFSLSVNAEKNKEIAQAKTDIRIESKTVYEKNNLLTKGYPGAKAGGAAALNIALRRGKKRIKSFAICRLFVGCRRPNAQCVCSAVLSRHG